MTKVYMAAILSSSIIGLSFFFSKIGLEYSSPLDLLAYRFTFAFAAVLIILIFKLVKTNITKKLFIKVLPLAFFYPLLSFGFQAYGLQFIQSSEAGILFAVGPVFTLILASYFLKEETSWGQRISILLSVFGVIYISLSKKSSLEVENLKGVIFILISVVSLSMYNVLGRKLGREVSRTDIIIIILGVGFVVFNLLALSKHVIEWDISAFFRPLKSYEFIVSVLYLGVLSSLLTSYLTIYVLSHLESYKMSVFGNFSTVVSILAGAILLNEKIFYFHILGSILIITGVFGANYLGRQKKQPKL